MHMIQWGLSAPKQTTFPYLPLHTWEFIAKVHSLKQLLCPSTLRQKLPFQGKLNNSTHIVSNPSRPVLGLPWPFCSTQPSLYDQQCPDGSDGKCLEALLWSGMHNPLINLNETQDNPGISAPFLVTIFCRFWTTPTYTITMSTLHLCCRAELHSTGQGRDVNNRMRLVQPSSSRVKHHCSVCSHGEPRSHMPPRNATFSSFLTPQPYGHEKHFLRLIQRRNEYSPVVTALLNDSEAQPSLFRGTKRGFW